LNGASKLFRKLFGRQRKFIFRWERESTVTVREVVKIEVTGVLAPGDSWDPHSKSEYAKQLVKSLSDAGLL
jgi:hypothetical protein